MAEICKNIDAGISDLEAALNRLNNNIDALSRRIQELDQKQKECCDEKKNNNNVPSSNNNDNNYEERIKELEKNQEALKMGVIPGQSELDYEEEIRLMIQRSQITAAFLRGEIHPDRFLDFLDEQELDVFELADDWELVGI